MNAIKEKKQDRAALVEELTKAGAKITSGNSFRCPFHDDHTPSAGIFQSDNGWRYKCQKCNAQGDYWDAKAYNEGKTSSEVLKAVRVEPVASVVKPAKVYDFDGLVASMPGTKKKSYLYGDDSGVKMVVVRSETQDGKTFRQARPHAGGYVWGAPAKPWPIYNELLIQKSQQQNVVVVEGEKCCECLEYFDILGTTSPAGAKNARNADWSLLSGKVVIVWRDFDAAGLQYQNDVLSMLESLPTPPASIRTIDPERLGLGDKQDVADYARRLMDAGKTRDEIRADLQAVIDDAEPVKHPGGASELSDELEDVISGKIETVPLRHRQLNVLTRALKPGTVTLRVGNSGAGKSLDLFEDFVGWYDAGYKACLFCLEESLVFHTRRILAQRAGIAGLTDDVWVAENPEIARVEIEKHKNFIDAMAKLIRVCPDDMPSLSDVADYIEAQCRAGFRIVGADPITGARHTTKESWNEDKIFLRRCEQSAKRYGASIILITHPVKTVLLPDLNALAGSAAYGRFCQTAIWLQSHEEKESTIRTDCGKTTVSHNRTMWILKSRNGKGQGLKLAYQFDAETLRLRELGIIFKEKKNSE